MTALIAPLFCLITLFYSFVTVWEFMSFLSGKNQQSFEQESHHFLYALWKNSSLVFLLIIQHSWLKTNQIKTYLIKYRLNSSVARCIYVTLTSIVLQVINFQIAQTLRFSKRFLRFAQILMKFWSPVLTYKLWKIEMNEDSLMAWMFSLIEVVAWSFIYGGSLLLDFPELVGVKQVRFLTIIKKKTKF